MQTRLRMHKLESARISCANITVLVLINSQVITSIACSRHANTGEQRIGSVRRKNIASADKREIMGQNNIRYKCMYELKPKNNAPVLLTIIILLH